MQETPQLTRQRARSEAMRERLLDVARRLFSERGYGETSTPDIVREAGVTRGALYHHFADKEALFRAVIEREFAAVASVIEQDEPAHAPLEALRAGSRRYFEAMRDEGRVRLLLRDGPAVLGVAAMSDIDAATSANALKDGLAAAMAAGEIRQLPLEALTPMISALFDRAALAVSAGAALEPQLAVIDAIFEGLRP